LEAAGQLVEEANPELFTSRALSQKSGYSLGTLVRRLNTIENVFLWAIKTGRDKKFAGLSIKITQFDADTSIQSFAEIMVDEAFSGFQRVNPKVIRFFENRITKINGFQPDYFAYMDVLVEPYLEAAHKNKTGTFRQMSKNEAALILRQLSLLCERPFVEGNPIAGTNEHRQIAIDTIIRLLGE